MPPQTAKPITVLIAEDDPDDRPLLREAFKANRLRHDLRFVEDGEELMDYLYLRGKSRGSQSASRPGLILMDLNMPRRDGRETLVEIKADPNLRKIPVVVLSTSKINEDITRCYKDGADSYIAKPVAVADLIEAVKLLGKYWLETVSLPPYETGG